MRRGDPMWSPWQRAATWGRPYTISVFLCASVALWFKATPRWRRAAHKPDSRSILFSPSTSSHCALVSLA